MSWKKFAILMLCVCYVADLTAADIMSCNDTDRFHFEHLKQENGLAQNSVYCILQDRTGFVWIGTKDGLNRFDGSRFKTFRKESMKSGTSIGNNFIRTLHEDANGKIWVGTDEGIYIFDPWLEDFSFFDVEATDGTVITKEVNDIESDKYGNIWIGNWQGLFKYNTVSNQLIHFSHNPDIGTSLSSDHVLCIYVDSDNIIWVGTQGGGINCYQSSTNDFIAYKVGKNGKAGEVYSIIETNIHSLLIGTSDNGIQSMNRISGKITSYIKDSPPMFVRNIVRISESELWIGTESGLYVYYTETDDLRHYTHNAADSYSLSDNAIYSIYKDRSGGVWVGTYFGGLNYLPSSYPFKKSYHVPGSDGITGNAVREFQEDPEGNLWIGTEDAGLFYFDVSENEILDYDFKDKLSYHNVHALLLDGDFLWIGYFSKGMDRVDLRTGTVHHFSSRADGGTISADNVFSLYKDRSGNIWIGTTDGLDFLSAETGIISQVLEVGRNVFVYDIAEDRNGIIWFATYKDGIFCYNPRVKEWMNIRREEGNSESLGYDKIIGLFEDSKGRMWISTEGGGASVWLPDEKRFRTYTVDDGLPNNVVYKILEDKFGDIWMTTNQGLACLDIETEEFKTYSYSDGLLSDQFNYKSGIRTHDEKIYLGSVNGFISFDPEEIASISLDYPSVVFTGFRIFNENVEIDPDSCLKQSIVFTKKIILKHNQSTFSFDFAALDFSSKETAIAYKLENYDRDWTVSSQKESINYYNIPTGKYVLKVRNLARHDKREDNCLAVEIIVRPPFYASYPGIGIWLLLSGTVIYNIVIYYKKRIRAKNIRHIRNFEIEKEKTVYKSQINFFTNIAHEIRTPLSLIVGPFEQIKRNALSPEENHENMEIIGSNITRLLSLTDQMLDFRKIENDGFALNFVQTDVRKIIESVIHCFKADFRLKKIRIQTKLPSDPLITFTDKEALTKVFTNLICNASKFADKWCIIELCIDSPQPGYFSFIIRNDGNRISPENAEHVFDMFFQERHEIGKGTGLGLPLVRHLVTLLQGKVYLDQSDSLNCFIVEIPVCQSQPHLVDFVDVEPDVPIMSDVKKLTGSENERGHKHILVVEDDSDMSSFLRILLSKLYKISFADNGRNAIKVLEKECIDLILSDIAMPQMNGIELCKYVKTSQIYSHIPVILLTARTSLTAKIEGLEARADLYIEKPFSPDLLLVQLETLFNNKKLLKESFSHNPLAYQDMSVMSKEDEKFIEDINDIVLDHLDDEEFSINQLADKMHISRSKLHKKIKSITSYTPNDFIRFVRLKRAAELLESQNFRINEICYQVGFGSPSYFSKCFYRQYGVLPKDFNKAKLSSPSQSSEDSRVSDS